MFGKILLSVFLATTLQSGMVHLNKPTLHDLGLKIKQGNQRFIIDKVDNVLTLTKDRFSLVFNLKKDDEQNAKYYSAKLVAETNPAIFDQFKSNTPTSEIPALIPGTGMAGPRDGAYDCLFLDDETHHFIFYSNEADRRANRISEKNGVMELAFDIENFCHRNSDLPIINSDFDKLFLVFFVDQNLNNILEKGEFVKIKIKLK